MGTHSRQAQALVAASTAREAAAAAETTQAGQAQRLHRAWRLLWLAWCMVAATALAAVVAVSLDAAFGLEAALDRAVTHWRFALPLGSLLRPDHLLTYALCAACGVVAGFLSGLLGIGGALVMVPAMYLLLPALGVAPQALPHVVVATSLAAMVCLARRQVPRWRCSCAGRCRG